MQIVVTNDDGIDAPGLRALVDAAMSIGDVTVIAPDRNWSASGHQKALGRPLRVNPYKYALDIPAFATDGGPSDCSALAGLGFLDRKPDLILSGINPTANLSLDMTYSGTVTSALEATVWGIRGVAFSIDNAGKKADEIDFSAAKVIIRHVLEVFLQESLPPHTVLNVNIPGLPLDEIKGYKVTRAGERFYRDELVKNIDPFGRPYYWFGGAAPDAGDGADTDSGELSRGFVSITPVHLDLTAHHMIEKVDNWQW